MKLRWALAAAMAAGFLAGGAQASIPPIGHKAPTWTGPAKVCANAFAIQIGDGEVATAGWPSVGRIPYTIQTAKGRVDLVELWTVSPPTPVPDGKDIGRGTLHKLAEPSLMAAGTPSAEYVFLPNSGTMAVVAIFYGGDWTTADHDRLFARVDYGYVDQGGCSPKDAA